MTHTRRSALTLLELLIVLAILSVLALVAVLGTESAVDQARYDATRRTIDNAETAVLGPANPTDADGNTSLAGFVADNGVLPVAPAAPLNVPETALGELYVKPDRLLDYQLRVVAAAATAPDPDIVLGSGWRGPYLRPSTQAINTTGVPKLLDGWGNPFVINGLPPGTALPANTEITTVQSLGGPSAPYTGVLGMSRPFTPTNTTGSLVVQVEDSLPDSAMVATVRVRLYVADARVAAGSRLIESDITLDANRTGSATFGSVGGVAPAVDRVVPIGTVAIRAYALTSGTPDQTKRSAVRYVRVLPGGPSQPVVLKFDIP